MGETSPMSEQPILNPDQTLRPRKRKRGFETALDMVRSMGLVGLAVLAVFLVTWRPAPETPFQPVDPVSVALGAQEMVSFELLVPDLDSAWQSNSAWLEPVPNDITKSHWHIGWVKGSDQYFAIEQSNTELESWSAAFGGAVTETFETSGVTWSVLEPVDADNLVYQTELDGSVLILVGTIGSDFAQLVEVVSKQISLS
ncbi:MAG: hypothetical protein RL038_1263 [Actinomycetota bacterium]